MRIRTALTAAMAGLAVPAAAGFQPLTGGGGASSFGDDRLSYSDGVIYDDDLVPGRPPGQPFLVDEKDPVRSATPEARPQPNKARLRPDAPAERR